MLVQEHHEMEHVRGMSETSGIELVRVAALQIDVPDAGES